MRWRERREVLDWIGLDLIWEIRTENEMSFGNWLRIEKCPLCLKDECLVVCYS